MNIIFALNVMQSFRQYTFQTYMCQYISGFVCKSLNKVIRSRSDTTELTNIWMMYKIKFLNYITA